MDFSVLVGSPLFYVVISIIVAVILGIGGLFVASKFDIHLVNIAKSIVNFVQTEVSKAEIKDSRIALVIKIVLSSLTYALAFSTAPNKEEKIEDAIAYIETACTLVSQENGVKIELNDTEIEVIKYVLTLTFDVIESYEAQQKTVKAKSLMKYNK